MSRPRTWMRHPLRIQRRRTKGWTKPEGSVCVTRPGVFGNPFLTAASFAQWLETGEIQIDDLLPRSWFPWTEESEQRIQRKRANILDRLPDLFGKQVACFCGLNQSCHGDVLARLANTVSVSWLIPAYAVDNQVANRAFGESLLTHALEMKLCRKTSEIEYLFGPRGRGGECQAVAKVDTLPWNMPPIEEAPRVYTLGEYRLIAIDRFGKNSGAVAYMDERIAEYGEDTDVGNDEEWMMQMLKDCCK